MVLHFLPATIAPSNSFHRLQYHARQRWFSPSCIRMFISPRTRILHFCLQLSHLQTYTGSNIMLINGGFLFSYIQLFRSQVCHWNRTCCPWHRRSNWLHILHYHAYQRWFSFFHTFSCSEARFAAEMDAAVGGTAQAHSN